MKATDFVQRKNYALQFGWDVFRNWYVESARASEVTMQIMGIGAQDAAWSIAKGTELWELLKGARKMAIRIVEGGRMCGIGVSYEWLKKNLDDFIFQKLAIIEARGLYKPEEEVQN